MPVFGKGRSKRPNRPAHEKLIERKLGKRIIERRQPWGVRASDLETVQRNLGFNFIEEIKQRLKKQETVNVLDWGCGAGTAISELGAKFPKKVKAYGCSDTAYSDWKGKRLAKFIHATKEDALRYFKDKSLDIIYSHYGLLYVKETDYAVRLAQKLKVGGILVMDVAPSPKAWADLEKQGFSVKTGNSTRSFIISRQ